MSLTIWSFASGRSLLIRIGFVGLLFDGFVAGPAVSAISSHLGRLLLVDPPLPLFDPFSTAAEFSAADALSANAFAALVFVEPLFDEEPLAASPFAELMPVEPLFDDELLEASPFAAFVPVEPLFDGERFEAKPFAVFMPVERLVVEEPLDALPLDDKALGELLEDKPFAEPDPLPFVVLVDDKPLALKLFLLEVPLFDDKLLDDEDLDCEVEEFTEGLGFDLKEELFLDPKLLELLLRDEDIPRAELELFEEPKPLKAELFPLLNEFPLADPPKPWFPEKLFAELKPWFEDMPRAEKELLCPPKPELPRADPPCCPSPLAVNWADAAETRARIAQVAKQSTDFLRRTLIGIPFEAAKKSW